MNKLFRGGVPTGVDVDALMKHIEPMAGQSISYDDVAAVIKVSPDSNRFRTVTAAWRKRLFREKRLETKAEGDAFHFLSADQAHAGHIRSVMKIGRATGRLQVKLSCADPTQMSAENKDQHFRASRFVGAIAEEMRRAAKEIAAPRPVLKQTEQ